MISLGEVVYIEDKSAPEMTMGKIRLAVEVVPEFNDEGDQIFKLTCKDPRDDSIEVYSSVEYGWCKLENYIGYLHHSINKIKQVVNNI